MPPSNGEGAPQCGQGASLSNRAVLQNVQSMIVHRLLFVTMDVLMIYLIHLYEITVTLHGQLLNRAIGQNGYTHFI